MNNYTAIGRLTKNTKTFTTQTGKIYAFNTIAINRGKDLPAIFVNFQVWEKQAINLEKFTKKGDMIGITGNIGNIKDKNDFSQLIVIANLIQFLNTKKENLNDKYKIEDSKKINDDFAIDVEEFDFTEAEAF